jgi:hypothetical protein
MSYYAVVYSVDNIVDNVIVLDAGSIWSPPEDHYIVNIDSLEVGIGWSYDPITGQWTPPPPPPEPAQTIPAEGAGPTVI